MKVRVKSLKNRYLPQEFNDWKIKDMLSWTEMKKELEEREYMMIYDIMSRLVQETDFLLPYGIHGLAHTKRVLMLVLCLGAKLSTPREDLLLLSLCALYHDVGRVDDSVAPEHGRISFAKAEPILIKTGYDMEMMRYIIENHCLSDRKGHAAAADYDLPDQLKARRLLDIFKDADGLDRVRIGDLDPRMLRHEEARKLLPVARQLMMELH